MVSSSMIEILRISTDRFNVHKRWSISRRTLSFISFLTSFRQAQHAEVSPSKYSPNSPPLQQPPTTRPMNLVCRKFAKLRILYFFYGTTVCKSMGGCVVMLICPSRSGRRVASRPDRAISPWLSPLALQVRMPVSCSSIWGRAAASWQPDIIGAEAGVCPAPQD